MLMIPCSQVLSERQVLYLHDTTNPPYSTSTQDGLVDLIVREAFHRSGLDVKMVNFPSERGLMSANQGTIDGNLMRIDGLEKKFQNLIRVPEVLIVWEFTSFSRSNNQPSMIQLKNHSIGYIRGWQIYEQMFPKTKNVTTVESSAQLFLLLAKGRIEYALHERWIGGNIVKSSGFNDIYASSRIIAKKDMFIYLHKKHSSLVPKIANELKNLKKEGFYDKVYTAKLKFLRRGSMF